MKALALLFFSILLLGCGTSKSSVKTATNDENKLILPPDVPSNKYSKTRQRGRD